MFELLVNTLVEAQKSTLVDGFVNNNYYYFCMGLYELTLKRCVSACFCSGAVIYASFTPGEILPKGSHLVGMSCFIFFLHLFYTPSSEDRVSKLWGDSRISSWISGSIFVFKSCIVKTWKDVVFLVIEFQPGREGKELCSVKVISAVYTGAHLREGSLSRYFYAFPVPIDSFFGPH